MTRANLRDILPDPLLTLHTREDVKDAVDRDLRAEWGKKYQFARHIRSEWVVSLIDEIEKSGQYPYNAVVKKLAWERLGYAPLKEADYANEGDTLSLLIYNAQCYRRSDRAKALDAAETAAGWVRPTEEWLKARVGKRVEVLGVDDGPCRVDRTSGEVVVRPPRTRNKRYALDQIKVRDV